MNLLLDTHALIWFLENDSQLSALARSAISDPVNCCYVSDASVWEVGIKHSLGKLKLPVAFEILFPARLLEKGFHSLPIRHVHLHQIVHLPFYHRDPFDRLLIAQAQIEEMTVVSSDSHFSQYDIRVLW
jgi:PIN domain nuclease of toxin-antitoxin system